MASSFYKFSVSSKGWAGDAYEMAVKEALGLTVDVSPKGKPDFKFGKRCIDVKQNGTCIKYDLSKGYVVGSSRVLFATHISYNEYIENGFRYVSVNLSDTDMYLVDKNAFIKFLLSLDKVKAVKLNKARAEANIQTMWNYSTGKRHGHLAEYIEAWARENEAPEACDLIGAILEGC